MTNLDRREPMIEPRRITLLGNGPGTGPIAIFFLANSRFGIFTGKRLCSWWHFHRLPLGASWALTRKLHNAAYKHCCIGFRRIGRLSAT